MIVKSIFPTSEVVMKPISLSFLLLPLLFFACTEQKKENGSAEKKEIVKKEKPSNSTKPIIMFFGNSITAGYQLDPEDAFPALIGRKLDSLGYQYQVINAGLSGETSAGGLERIDWVLRTVPDIFVLELGANDGLRGLDLAESKENLQKIIGKVKAGNPKVKVVIAGMMMPPNLGKKYTDDFQQLFVELAGDNDAVLIPFLLEGVAGEPDLNLSDGIHPTEEGHQIVAKTVWQYLEPLVEKTE